MTETGKVSGTLRKMTLNPVILKKKVSRTWIRIKALKMILTLLTALQENSLKTRLKREQGYTFTLPVKEMRKLLLKQGINGIILLNV